MKTVFFKIEEFNEEECLMRYSIESWLPGVSPTWQKEPILSKTDFISMYKLWIEGSNEDGKEQQRH